MNRLMLVTEAAYAAEQGKMSSLHNREAELRAKIADLKSARNSQDKPIEEDYSKRAGVDFLWQRWVERSVSALNAELARTLLEKERCRLKLTREFGKYQMAGHLYKRARIEAQRLAEKRAERDA